MATALRAALGGTPVAAIGAAALMGTDARAAAPSAASTRTRPAPPPRRAHTAPSAERGPAYGAHAGARAIADQLAASDGIERAWTLAALVRARRIAAVQRLVMPPEPGVRKNWRAYRDRFVEPDRIAGGLAFWRAHAEALEQAQARYGVPAEIVVAIVGVETYYGRIVGNFRVVDALATLAFDFPAGRRDRSEFFRAELVSFLRWCHREGLDPLEPRGSYAGAIGLPQFMPSSILEYGVDGDGDGHVELRRAGADVVASVAHYLARYGWQRGQPTHFDVQPPAEPEPLAQLLAPDIVPSFAPAQLAERGAVLEPAALQHAGPLALVRLENGDDAPSYYAGTRNFYAVTRYNWSSYYAMAVILLAEALRAGR